MLRRLALLLALVCGLPTLAQAGGDGLAGRWKVVIFEENQVFPYWILSLEAKDGKLVGTTEPILGKIPPTKASEVVVDGDRVRFSLKIDGGPTFQFEGKLPRAGAKKVFGSVNRGGASTPAFLEATQAKNAFELAQEIVTRTPNDPRVFNAVVDLIEQAKAKKIPARDVQEWIDAGLRSAENHGPTWQLDYGIRLVNRLVGDFPGVAVDAAVKLDKDLATGASADQQLRLLSAATSAAKAAGRDPEAAAFEKRVGAVEDQAHAEYVKKGFDFKIEKGAKLGRPVLVELFTGAQCPPCVAADIGFDALGRAFGATDVVLLQYHLHIPGPDVLTNADTEGRAEFYGRSLRGTPAIFFNGKAAAPGGGGAEDAGEKAEEYRRVVETIAKREAGAKIALTATRKGESITLAANVTDVAAPGAKVKLRFALTEDWVRYRGSNGLTFHHHVVRALPGGVAGFPVAEKTLEKSVTVDLGELRKGLTKYLDEFVKAEGPFPDSQRPMRLRDLHAVAFVQSDESGEVLCAVAVPVKE